MIFSQKQTMVKLVELDKCSHFDYLLIDGWVSACESPEILSRIWCTFNAPNSDWGTILAKLVEDSSKP